MSPDVPFLKGEVIQTEPYVLHLARWHATEKQYSLSSLNYSNLFLQLWPEWEPGSLADSFEICFNTWASAAKGGKCPFVADALVFHDDK